MKWTVAILDDNLAGVVPDLLKNHDTLNNTESQLIITSRKRKEREEDLALDERELKLQKDRQQLEDQKSEHLLRLEEHRERIKAEKQNHLVKLYSQPALLGDAIIQQMIKDQLAQTMTESNKLPQEEKFAPDITEIANSLGFSTLGQSERTRLGKFIAKNFKLRFPEEKMLKTRRFVMGEMRAVNTYTLDKKEWLNDFVSEWCNDNRVSRRL